MSVKVLAYQACSPHLANVHGRIDRPQLQAVLLLLASLCAPWTLREVEGGQSPRGQPPLPSTLRMSQRLGLWAKGAPGMAEGKLEVLEKFFQPSWAWEQESSRTSSSYLGSSIHPRQLGKGSLIGRRDLRDRLRFSAFLDEITQRVLSPAQLQALGWRGAPDQLRYSPPQGRQRTNPPGQLIFPEDQLSEMQTQSDLPEPQGGPLDTGSTAEDDGDGDPEFSLGQVCQELMTLKEQFLRLQEDLASTHRAHQVLEEKLQSLVCLRAGASPEEGKGGGQPAPAPTPGSYPNSFYSSPSGPRCSFS